MDIFLILFIVSILACLVFVFLWWKQTSTANQYQNDYLVTNAHFEQTKEELQELKMAHAILNTRYEDELNASREKVEVLQSAKDELSMQFKNLSNKIFEDKAKQFNATSKEQLELLLKPFREQVHNFAKQSQEQHQVDIKERHLLKDELTRLKQMNEQLSQDALNLTNALKGENKTQGNWGEIVLARILEESGLREGVEYETQATLKDEGGKSYRPDVIIHMPQERDIIIDSKVSLVAYERFMSEEDPHAKAQALKEHLLSISTHIKGLSSKKYEKLEGVHTLDFVLLFMPIEGAFMSALEADGEFFKHAFEQNILVVSPSTLLVTLRTIEHIWRTQRQEEHAKMIAAEAEAMYEKLVLFVDEMQKIGNHLDKAKDSYDKSISRLSTGRGNVIRRAEKMIELGLKPKKKLSLTSEDE